MDAAHEIKKLFEEYEAAEAETEKHEDNEEMWDLAYKKEFEAHERLTKKLMDTLKADRQTINAMIATKRDTIRSLINSLA